MRRLVVFLSMLVALVAIGVDARADRPRPHQGTSNETPPELAGIDVEEHLGAQLPRDVVFKDTSGNMVSLGSFFDGKRPTLLVFAYHNCPVLCSMVLDATKKVLKEQTWTVGREFDVVSISIDPRDTPETAKKKQDQVAAQYGRDGANGPGGGWHFLVGDQQNVTRVTDAVGFKYRYDERQGQYAHPAAIYLLTPEGKIARYLYGIDFDPKDVRLGLLEASEGRSISTVEKLIMWCYHYDPQGKKYSLLAMNVMRLGGGLTAVLLGGLLTVLWLRERKKQRAKKDSSLLPTRAEST
jgi:protein SCO1/2